MRPGRRLLAVGLAALAVSLLVIASGETAAEAALFIWAGIGSVLFIDLMTSASAKHWSINIEAPNEIFTGENGHLQFVIDFNGRKPPAEIRAKLAYPKGISGPEEILFGYSEDGSQAGVRVRLTARQRGAWVIDEGWLYWKSRFGLLEFVPRSPLDIRINVVPNIRPIQSGQIDVAVRSALFGSKQNVLQGEGSEFHQLREFTNGMDTRSIDWKRSARHRSLVAKEMRAERNHQIILALDNGFLMSEEIAGLPKIDHAVNAALVTAWAGVLGGDMVGLFAFDSTPRVYLPPQAGRGGFARLRSQTAELDYRSVESNPTLAMAHLHSRLQRRSLIVIFTDFVDTTTSELLVENVGLLSRHHVVVFVGLRDPMVETIAATAPDTLSDVARSVTASQMLMERRIVFEKLNRIGVICVDVAPEAVSARLISTYLSIKSRELI
jgi:uncharacterized protein (DUF58 family)